MNLKEALATLQDLHNYCDRGNDHILDGMLADAGRILDTPFAKAILSGSIRMEVSDELKH